MEALSYWQAYSIPVSYFISFVLASKVLVMGEHIQITGSYAERQKGYFQGDIFIYVQVEWMNPARDMRVDGAMLSGV